MPELKRYRLFISHAWKYNEEYYGLVRLLEGASNFSFANYSVPTHDPLVDSDSSVGKKKLQGLLDAQIRPVNIVLVISGMYAAYKEWIQYEIDQAAKMNKAIIGVKPQGQIQIPVAVSSVATEMVGWNTATIVAAIRKHSI